METEDRTQRIIYLMVCQVRNSFAIEKPGKDIILLKLAPVFSLARENKEEEYLNKVLIEEFGDSLK